MSERVFGIDFGTTNSLVAIVEGNAIIDLVDSATMRPHPSVVWYRGPEVVVGAQAKAQMDLTDGSAPPGFVRSPKSALRGDGPLYVDGQTLQPSDVVAEVLKYLRADAEKPRESDGYTLNRAVVTIPVDFGGKERRSLRKAARNAGISITQFVHEPAAALYAYLRSSQDEAQDVTLSRLEGRTVLVFDWGGGTLDLTLCRISCGVISQIANAGVNEIGGDRFDERIRNLVREKHASAHRLEDVTALEQPGMAARLLQQCERVKISLSRPTRDFEVAIVKNYLRAEGDIKDLNVRVSKQEIEDRTRDIVRRGLVAVDELLDRAGYTHQDIALCLATGGMTNVPAIRNGLTERFLGRVPLLPNSDTIIAEGAAWIAHDGVRLTLSKPIEILVADTSGFGTYHPLAPAGQLLPVENQVKPLAKLRLLCTDPRDGRAVVELAKPSKLGRIGAGDARLTIGVATVDVDPIAAPLVERIKCELQIDQDFIGKLILTSETEGHRTELEFYDIEFSLSLREADGHDPDQDTTTDDAALTGHRSPRAIQNRSNVTARTNVSVKPDRRVVPGDVARLNWPEYFGVQSREPTLRQKQEDEFYTPCALCHRLPTEFNADGCEQCHIPAQRQSA